MSQDAIFMLYYEGKSNWDVITPVMQCVAPILTGEGGTL